GGCLSVETGPTKKQAPSRRDHWRDASRHPLPAPLARIANRPNPLRRLHSLRQRTLGAASPASSPASWSRLFWVRLTPRLHWLWRVSRSRAFTEAARAAFNKPTGCRKQCGVRLGFHGAWLCPLFCRTRAHLIGWRRRVAGGAGELERFRADSYAFVGSCSSDGCLSAVLQWRSGSRQRRLGGCGGARRRVP